MGFLDFDRTDDHRGDENDLFAVLPAPLPLRSASLYRSFPRCVHVDD